MNFKALEHDTVLHSLPEQAVILHLNDTLKYHVLKRCIYYTVPLFNLEIKSLTTNTSPLKYKLGNYINNLHFHAYVFLKKMDISHNTLPDFQK